MAWVQNIPKYEYKPLGTDQNLVRLLVLKPGHEEDPNINCELVTVDLDRFINVNRERRTPGISRTNTSLPNHQGTHIDYRNGYEALSWNWGDLPGDRALQIFENGRRSRLTITRNLENALRVLRYRETTSRLIWIDMVCIDQQNDTERNRQVQKMTGIYSNAKMVNIWLGESDGDTEKLIKFIQEEMLDVWRFDQWRADWKNSRLWIAFNALLQKKWFFRRWIIQEVAMAKEATLYCGKYKIDWQDFTDAVRLFGEAESANGLSNIMKRDQTIPYAQEFFGDFSSLGAITLVNATSTLYRDNEFGKREFLLDLNTLVTCFTVFEASEPKDIVFAVLAMAKDVFLEIREESGRQFQSLSPFQRRLVGRLARTDTREPYVMDYKAPVIQVYTDFVQYTMRRSNPTRCLDIMFRPWAPNVEKMPGKDERAPIYMRHDIEYIKLPSWMRCVSDYPFLMKNHPSAGSRMERRNADPLVGVPTLRDPYRRQANYSACGSHGAAETPFVPRSGTFSLMAFGFKLYTVKKVWDIAQFGDVPVSWLEAFGWTNPKTPPPDKFWQTLVADRDGEGKRAPRYFKEACRAAVAGGWIETYSTRVMIHESQRTILTNFLRRAQAVVWNRRLVTLVDTEATGRPVTPNADGVHIGLADKSVKRGDTVCILFGCSVPVILRAHEKSEEEVERERQEDDDYFLRDELTMQVAMKLATRFRSRKRAREEAAAENPGEGEGAKRHQLQPPSPTATIQRARTEIHRQTERQHALRKYREVAKVIETEREQNRARIEENRFWTVVGECYVHGVMNGEALETRVGPNARNEQFDRFELR